MSDQAYGCGACPGESEATCAQCDGVEGESACNAEVDAGKTFKCFSHTYDSEATAWAASEEAGTCHALADTAVICNM